METPPHTPNKVGRLSASELESSSHLMSPTQSQRRSVGSTPVSRARNSIPRSSMGAMDSPYSRRTPERPPVPLATPLSDRFIPERDPFGEDLSRFLLDCGKENPGASPSTAMLTKPGGYVTSSVAEPYAAALTRSLFDEDVPPGVLPFHRGTGGRHLSETRRFENCRAVIYEENRKRSFMSTAFRVIPQTPERILDAPDLIDDYYLNLLDWSSNNTLAVALNNALYLWHADSGSIKQLMSGEPRTNVITGVSWNHDGSQLAIGLNDCSTTVWDPETAQPIVSFKDHTGRVGALSWNGPVLASGSRDSTIRLYDTRARSCFGCFQGHTQEICGLKWNPSGTQLASGGNDNLLNVWDFKRQSRECTPTLVITQHKAAVKAIAWNPVHTGILASGGGTADKSLKLWNVAAGELVNSVDTKSQVCGAVWNRDGTEIVTSHGYVDNQLTIWKYPSLTKVTDLTGHSSRVLHLAMSPDGETVVSAAGDETIRFWRCFANPTNKKDAARTRPRPLDDACDFELESLR
jgi:cell division cycle protein 20 (cofactor of APC complex)